MKFCFYVLPLLILLSACSLFEKKGEVIAQVDKEKLTMEEFKSNFSEVEWKSLSSEQKKEYVQQWVNMTLLAREADKLGFGKDKKVLNKIHYATQKIKGNALIASKLEAEKISEEDMFNYYRIHQGDFDQSALNYQVQRIFLTDPALVNKVKQEIANGMRFEDAARVYSQEENGKTGGYMGLVTPTGADSTFWLASQKLQQLEVGTLQTPKGNYLIRYTASEPGTGPTGFEAQKGEIRRRILDERRKQVYDDLLKELKSKSEIYLMI
jgi:peptidyl-prolyl cis-trans isomerase C